MMNNQFNAANLTSTQPHGIQMSQHVATSPPQTSAAVLNTFYAQSQQQHHHQQQQQHLAAAVAAANGGLYADPRQLQLTAAANPLDKTYYTTAGAATTLGAGTPQRFYTTASGAPIAGANAPGHTAAHPNTILITNNFTHQQTQPQSTEQQRVSALNPANIRIVTSSANHSNLASSSSAGGAYQQAQHVFNLNNTKALHQLFPQHILQQQQTNFQHAPELIHFGTQHFPSSQNAATSVQVPQYYVASETAVAQLPANPKILGNMPTNAVTTASGNATSSSSSSVNVVGGTANANGSSTVVLDRINICINNLYTDTSSSSASNSLASTPAQQPSPIIPAIQHKAIIDNGTLVSAGGDIYESSVLVIDEPDSTTTATTPHTPPTTPENTPPSVTNNPNASNNNMITTTSSITSPTTSSCSAQQQDIQTSNTISTTKQNFAAVAQNIEEAAVQDPISAMTNTFSKTSAATYSCTPSSQIPHSLPTNAPLTPPTPPSPEVSNTKQATINLTCPSSMTSPPPPPARPLFASGEDVFIKRLDGRFYLGTVMDTARNQFLVRFDDKTELWCNSDEMRKLGGGCSTNSTSTSENKAQDQPMCVACKQQQPDSQVEICERCGRGYHRKCSMETSTNSGIWMCKRCDKPMKLSALSDDDEDYGDMDVCRQLPYDLNSLNWDSKHRVNEEQTYCYCGKSGKFDHNMLQCCRCLNWYHTQCSHKFKGSLLRGDSFFVFSCTVCNDGEEYLRRLQLDWVDLVHLIIYNLSTMKKHQNHKYHHLLKDIYPFAIEKRRVLPMPEEWVYMPENDFLNKIKSTLKDNSERFVCGKEIKRDHYFFALRTNGPPISKPIAIKAGQLLNDDFIVHNLKLKFLPGAPENVDVRLSAKLSPVIDVNSTPTSKPKSNDDSSSHDIYAFDDTSDDEIPIKLILDKVKKKNKSTENLEEPTTPTSNKTTLEKMDVEDDNANDLVITQPPQEYSTLPLAPTNITPTKNDKKLSPKKETKPMKSSSETTTSTDENNPLLEKNVTANTSTTTNNTVKRSEKNSRKRKAFNLTKSYDKQRLFDSSSDENSSSSSRGTSLDLIIPPPKNFLGQNNPFRMVTPKKKTTDSSPSASSGGKKSVSFGIFNTNGLNFSSKLAALKSAGLFPNLSTSNLAKAAGQPRTVRTIKRRLSAKDITIGPNQEVRRRRTRRLSANIEVISTTTINPIPTNYFPIHAKDLLAAAAASTTTAASLFTTQSKTTFTSPSMTTSSTTLTVNSSTLATSLSNVETAAAIMAPTTVDTKPLVPTHGRRLRQRPPKSSPNTSRRNSVSSSQSSTSSTASATLQQQAQNAQQSHEDLKQTVNKYFGIVNRIESGEQFSIRAKRQLANGQMQYLIEWGEQQLLPAPTSPAPQQHVVELVAESATPQIPADLEIELASELVVEVKDNTVNDIIEIPQTTE